jgi:multiple sugar transport system permease protein
MTLIAAAILGLWSFFPIYWMVVSSLRPERDLFARPTLIPQTIDWKFTSYHNLLELTDYPLQFVNSVVVALAVVVITLLVSVVIAYVVTRYRVPGKTLIIASMLYAYMFPPLLLAIPLLSIFAQAGLADHLIAVVLAHCTLSIPLGVWMLWGFFKAMPFDLEEAAMVDGCSRAGWCCRCPCRASSRSLFFPSCCRGPTTCFRTSWSIAMPIRRCRSGWHPSLALSTPAGAN